MLFTTFVIFVVIFHEASSLKCYNYEEQHVNFWVDAKTLPSFPTNYSLVEAKHQCTATIRWFTLSNGKESLIDYFGDFHSDIIPKNSSLLFAFVAIERDLRSASTRVLVYSCTTDNCNNRTNLQKVLSSLILEENFAPLDVLFSNQTRNFTEQSSCVNFSNSTHLECPSSASPLSACRACLLFETESPQEVCTRCPEKLPIQDIDFVERRVFFFLENKTRSGDKITLVCRTKGCNTLTNAKKIYQLSKLEFHFTDFFVSTSFMN